MSMLHDNLLNRCPECHVFVWGSNVQKALSSHICTKGN